MKLTSQNERGNATNKARQKRVEGEGANETAIGELDNARQEYVAQVGVDELQSTRSTASVLRVKAAEDLEQIRVFSTGLGHGDVVAGCLRRLLEATESYKAR